MKKQVLFLTVALCITLAACGRSVEPQDTAPVDTTPIETSIPVEPAAPVDTTPIETSTPIEPAAPVETTPIETSTPIEPAAPVETTPAPADEQSATLFIGTKSSGFQEYPMSYEGELTPELLIQGIADLTGWDLTLAETVTTGKGGMSVCLSSESALFTGPPDPQKDEFHMFSADQLAETILDSIQKTLQMGFTGAGGDPDALDIYYYMKGEQPLELPDIGLSWPLDQPYQWPRI